MLFRLFYIRLTSIVLPLCLHIFIWLNLTIYIYSRKGSIDFYHLFFSFDLIFYLTFSSSILYLHSILVKLFYITFLLQFTAFNVLVHSFNIHFSAFASRSRLRESACTLTLAFLRVQSSGRPRWQSHSVAWLSSLKAPKHILKLLINLIWLLIVTFNMELSLFYIFCS